MALFGRKGPSPEEARGGFASPPVGLMPATAPARPPAGTPRAEAQNAVIGPNVRIQGELSGEEDIVVEGRVEGKITVTKALRIGAQAQVNAEVKAQNVVIAGKVVGNVTALDRVEILASGCLEGNIKAPKIAIAEGAQFRGSVDMSGKPGPVPAAAVHAPPATPSK